MIAHCPSGEFVSSKPFAFKCCFRLRRLMKLTLAIFSLRNSLGCQARPRRLCVRRCNVPSSVFFLLNRGQKLSSHRVRQWSRTTWDANYHPADRAKQHFLEATNSHRRRRRRRHSPQQMRGKRHLQESCSWSKLHRPPRHQDGRPSELQFRHPTRYNLYRCREDQRKRRLRALSRRHLVSFARQLTRSWRWRRLTKLFPQLLSGLHCHNKRRRKSPRWKPQIKFR